MTNECVESGLRQKRDALRQLPEFQSKKAETHLKLAELLMQQGDPNGAIEEYQAAIRINPRMSDAYTGLGAVHIDKHEWVKAKQALQKGTLLDPHNHEAWFWLGRSLIAQEHFHQAEEALVKATQLDPNNPQSHSDLGLVFMAEGQSKEAEKAITHAIALQPDFAEAHHRLEQVRGAWNDSGKLIQSAHHILDTLFRRE